MASATLTTKRPAPGRRTRARRWFAGFKLRETWAAYFFLSPWFFGFVVLTAGPMIASLVLSFTNYSVIAPTSFVGLENYRNLFSDPYVPQSLEDTFYYTVLSVPLTMAVSLFLAMLLNRVGRGSGFFRTVFYLPVMTPQVAVGVLYLLLFNGSYGIVDQALSVVGIKGPYWTTDPNWILPGFVFMSLWAVGANVVIYLAALRGVPKQLYEANAMDGASAWRRFKDVTLPMISPALFFTFIILTIAGIQQFTMAYTSFFNTGTNQTNGNTNALFAVIYLYQQAFSDLHIGYASAYAWILFVIIAIITAVQFIGSKRFVYYEGNQR